VKIARGTGAKKEGQEGTYLAFVAGFQKRKRTGSGAPKMLLENTGSGVADCRGIGGGEKHPPNQGGTRSDKGEQKLDC